MGVKYCDEYSCLSVHSHISKTTWRNFSNFLWMFPATMAWSRSGGIAILYVLSVLWMMSCARNGLSSVLCVFLSAESITAKTMCRFQPNLLSDKDQQIHIVGWMVEARSAAVLYLKQANVGAAIFSDVAGMMYNLRNVKRQWNTYLANVRLIPVASATSSTSAQPSDRKTSTSGIISCFQ